MIKNIFKFLVFFVFITPSFVYSQAVNLNSDIQLFNAFEYSETGVLHRKIDSGKALKALKTDKKINQKPEQRIDYIDFYKILLPTYFIGNKVIVLEEEYMTEYSGCCVDNGLAIVVELKKPIVALRIFAAKNKCELNEYFDIKEYEKENSLKLNIANKKYVRLNCREKFVSQLTN